MLGWYKCGACGKQFRPKRWQRCDICTECQNVGVVSRATLASEPSKSASELDLVEDRVRLAQYEQARARGNGISSMNESVARWQQLSRILNGPTCTLSATEHKKYEDMRRDLETSDALKALLRQSKRQSQWDRSRD